MITPREARDRVARWTTAVEEKPDSAAAHFNLGLAYTALGRMKQAEGAYRRALELDPELTEAWINLGGVLLLGWDFAGTLEANSRALQLDPDSLLAHYNAGQAHLYLGNAEGVVAENRRVIELDERHPAGHYFLAVGLLACGQVQAARRHLDQAVRLGHKPEPAFLKALSAGEQRLAREAPAPVMEIGN